MNRQGGEAAGGAHGVTRRLPRLEPDIPGLTRQLSDSQPQRHARQWRCSP